MPGETGLFEVGFMTDRTVESVSALMDGELTDFELRRTLEQTTDNPELAQTWRRYHLARSVMQSEAIALQADDISDRVMAALDAEPPLVSSDVTPATRTGTMEWLWKPLSSMAVAASVTAFVILGVQKYDGGVQAPELADARPVYMLPAAPVSNDYVRAHLANRVSLDSRTQGVGEPEVIRLSQGLSRYLSQHQHMLTAQAPHWQTGWLPKGFSNVRHEVLPGAEVMLFSDGRHSFTVCIERFGDHSVPAGVAQTDQVVAVAKRRDKHFVTVVGNVPLMIAERIASSVEPKRL